MEDSISTSHLPHMFWMIYLIVLAKKLYRMMMFESTMMLANLAMKLTVTVEISLIDTQM